MFFQDEKGEAKPQEDQLSTFISELEPYFPFKDREQYDQEKALNGHFNRFRLEALVVDFEARDPAKDFDEPPLSEEKAIPIVIQRPRPKWEEHIFQNVSTAFAHLRRRLEEEEFKAENYEYKKEDDAEYKPRKKLFSPFIQKFLCFGIGGKVSILAPEGNLGNWIRKNGNTVTAEAVKRIVSQLLAIVYDLHSRNLVHRDIKLENILTFINSDADDASIMLSDLDSTLHQNDRCETSGTTGYLAPECMKDEEISCARYRAAEKKAMDCYAVGHSIYKILCAIKDNPNISESDKADLQDLSARLKNLNPNPGFRWTIVEASCHPYFGETRDKRDELFHQFVYQYEEPDFYFDSYLYTEYDYYPKRGAGFFLWPRFLKEFFLEASSLNMQMQFVRDAFLFENTRRLCEPLFPLEPEHIEAIKRKIKKIEEILKSDSCEEHKKDNIKIADIFGFLERGLKHALDELPQIVRHDLSLLDRLKAGEAITLRILHHYFATEDKKNWGELSKILRMSKDGASDFECALQHFNEFRNNLTDPEDRRFRELLDNYEKAVRFVYKRSEIPLPLLTELTWRVLFSARCPLHKNNAPKGCNTTRALATAGTKPGFFKKVLVGNVVHSSAVAVLKRPKTLRAFFHHRPPPANKVRRVETELGVMVSDNTLRHPSVSLSEQKRESFSRRR